MHSPIDNWSDPDRRRKALESGEYLDDPDWPTCECRCGCKHPAVGEWNGVPLCEECRYIVFNDRTRRYECWRVFSGERELEAPDET